MGIQICSNNGGLAPFGGYKGQNKEILINLKKCFSHEPLAGMQ